jgi:transposase
MAAERMSIMETMERERRPRRSFSKEFKAEVVELVGQPGNTAASVARDLDLTETAVREWVKQGDIDDGRRDGLTTSEREELSRLRRENRRLQQDVEILKRATAFFAKETR